MPERIVGQHTWYTAADIAGLCEARAHGNHYRARCPAHGGDNPSSLRIGEGTDRHGNPCTLIKCYAHDCDIREICAALGIELRNLFCIHPDYAKSTRTMPRAKGPEIQRLSTLQEPSQDDIAEIMLIEMIRSDPAFIKECEPARETFYRLAQSPACQARLFAALKSASIAIPPFWRQLAAVYGEGQHAY